MIQRQQTCILIFISEDYVSPPILPRKPIFQLYHPIVAISRFSFLILVFKAYSILVQLYMLPTSFISNLYLLYMFIVANLLGDNVAVTTISCQDNGIIYIY